MAQDLRNFKPPRGLNPQGRTRGWQPQPQVQPGQAAAVRPVRSNEAVGSMGGIYPPLGAESPESPVSPARKEPAPDEGEGAVVPGEGAAAVQAGAAAVKSAEVRDYTPVLDLEPESILKGILFSEILGKPRSMRRGR